LTLFARRARTQGYTGLAIFYRASRAPTLQLALTRALSRSRVNKYA
jgi:hypothetical protein